MTTAASGWSAANQRHVIAVIAVVRRHLERQLARSDAEIASADAALADAQKALDTANSAMPSPPALDRLASVFNLSAFERQMLVLCVAPELDGSFAVPASEPFVPTFGVGLAALPDAHWSALLPSAPLRIHRLIDVGRANTLAASPLRVDERVLHFLAGADSIDARLRAVIEPAAWSSTPLPDSQRPDAERIVRLATTRGVSLVQLTGRDLDGKRAIASAVSDAVGSSLYLLNAADLPQAVEERAMLAQLWQREAMLNGATLFIDGEDADAPELRRVAAFVEQLHAMVFISAHEALPIKTRPSLRVDVRRPTATEQRRLWSTSLGDVAKRLNGQVDRVTSQFNLGAQQIRAAVSEVVASLADQQQVDDALWDVCRVQARPRLDQLAQRIETAATWDDLVLPPEQLAMLKQVASQVQHRATVYDDWQFANAGSRGIGISALFSGASGTGKTMAAEVIAQSLRLDLYRIDLSQVVSKYIGETEKNLRRIFDAAEEGGAVLLFDEADALFGKRSEVKDSHDRYANIEVSYLLQRMDTYRGLAILTTNLKSSIDAAFLRRLRFLVDFPFPDATHRAAIWQRVFPKATPTEAIEPAKLSRLNVSGGTIYNIALNAAFLAASAGEPVRMVHLRNAARSECRKLERQVTDAELREWV